MRRRIGNKDEALDPRLIDRLSVRLGKSSAISTAELSNFLQLALYRYQRLTGERRDDDAAEVLLEGLRKIGELANEIESIARRMKLPQQTSFYGMKLSFIPDEALVILRRASADYLDHLRQVENMPRWSRRREHGAVDRLILDIAKIWQDATGRNVTFTTDAVTNKVSGRFLSFFFEATRGVQGVPRTGTAIKSRYGRLKKAQRRQKNM